MPVKSLDHVQLAMPAGREAEARAFYQGVLGIPEVKKPADPRQARRLLVRARRPQDPPGRRGGLPPGAQGASGIDRRGPRRAVGGARPGGLCVRSDEPLEGYTRVYVDDPFGNRIELMEPNAPST